MYTYTTCPVRMNRTRQTAYMFLIPMSPFTISWVSSEAALPNSLSPFQACGSLAQELGKKDFQIKIATQIISNIEVIKFPTCSQPRSVSGGSQGLSTFSAQDSSTSSALSPCLIITTTCTVSELSPTASKLSSQPLVCLPSSSSCSKSPAEPLPQIANLKHRSKLSTQPIVTLGYGYILRFASCVDLFESGTQTNSTSSWIWSSQNVLVRRTSSLRDYLLIPFDWHYSSFWPLSEVPRVRQQGLVCL